MPSFAEVFVGTHSRIPSLPGVLVSAFASTYVAQQLLGQADRPAKRGGGWWVVNRPSYAAHGLNRYCLNRFSPLVRRPHPTTRQRNQKVRVALS